MISEIMIRGNDLALGAGFIACFWLGALFGWLARK